MKQFVPLRIRVKRDMVVRINRSMPGKGVITVLENQQVQPADIIGTANISSGFRILNLANLLGVNPKEVEKSLKRKLGQRIYKGELLAYKAGGIFGGEKTVIAPTDGVLDYLNLESGEMKMTLLPKKIDLPAGVYGVVEQIDHIKGKITIITQVSRVYGMFGSGKLRDGTLKIIGKREDLVVKSMISHDSEGHILVGGSLIYKDALSEAISCGVSGVITGGINAKDYKSMAGGRLIFPRKLENDIGISVVNCEGFGSIPIGLDIYSILSEYNNKFVLIDGNQGIIDLPSFTENSLIAVKNTKLPPFSGEMNTEEHGRESMEVKVGLKVRIVGNSFAGEQGKIISLDESPTLLPSGILCYLAAIETKRRKIKVPVVNLEVIDYID